MGIDPLSTLLQETLVLDTETTSLVHAEAEIIQYASASALHVLESVANESYDIPCSFHEPEKKIPPEISAITSITNRMVKGHPNFKDALPRIQKELDDHKYFVAHNAFYDSGVLRENGLKLPKSYFCTMRLARKIFADDENITAHNLSYLRYALNLPISDTLPAHLADADVMVTGILFVTLIEEAIKRGLIDGNGDIGAELEVWLDKPIIVTKMTFGKHKGKKLVEVPISYWQWALDNFDSLNEEDSAYDRDFAASVAIAIEEILEENA